MMRTAATYGIAFGVVLGLVALAAQAPASGRRQLTRAALEDKVRGGWAGQMVGVSWGQETEFRSIGKILEGPLPAWTPDLVARALEQDDLYVEMTFMDVMARHGLDATTAQHGEAFRDSKYMLWHANAGARRLLNRGVPAGQSGHPSQNMHANDIDFQIEADFIGLMTPGLPREANAICERVGRVMNSGDGLYGGMFVASLYAHAFFSDDPRAVVEQALESIPADSSYAAVVRDVITWSRANPDWRETWRQIEAKWNTGDSCPDGAMHPFNIDARLNGAYIVLGLLYGGGDFQKTMEVSMRAGQDSDCNPASAAGVLGVMLGYAKIPAKWTSGLPAVADRKFSYTTYSYNDVVRLSTERAVDIVRRAGGTVTDATITVPVQRGTAPALEQWSMGTPDREIPVAHADWTWKGNWSAADTREGGYRASLKVSTTRGDEASVTFTGTAVALVGSHQQDGGRAVVYLDGARVGEVDGYIGERTLDHDLWHAYGLTPGPHVLKVVASGEADARSTGRAVAISKAITFK